jgi:hypothetical protein
MGEGKLDDVPMAAAWYRQHGYARCLFGEDLAVREGIINLDDAHQMTFVCALRRET